MIAFELPEGVDDARYTLIANFAQDYETVLTLRTPSDQMAVKDGMLYLTLTVPDTERFKVGDVDAQIIYEDDTQRVVSCEVLGAALRTQETAV